MSTPPSRASAQGTRWPYSPYAYEFDRLPELLNESAAHHARTALRKFTVEDPTAQLEAAIGCGCAVELLAKAHLARVHPSLLADRPDADTKLHLSDNGGRATKPATHVKTISAADALAECKRLIGGFPYNPQTDSIVLEVRNAALHVALVAPKELRAAVFRMVQICSALLDADAGDIEKFWGKEQAETVKQISDEATTELKRVVSAKIAAARTQLANLVSGLDEASSRVVLSALSGKRKSSSDYEELHECPVCRQQGWLICGVERGEVQWEYDAEGEHWAEVSLTAYPFAFECPVCLLDLESAELMEFDFPEEIELEPDTDPWEAQEPDEDLYRGR